MTSLHELLHLAATPTDVRTECRICSRDSDPAILGDDGWVCVPCAIADPARAIVTSADAEGVSVWLGDRQLAKVRTFEPGALPSAVVVAAAVQMLLGDEDR